MTTDNILSLSPLLITLQILSYHYRAERFSSGYPLYSLRGSLRTLRGMVRETWCFPLGCHLSFIRPVSDDLNDTQRQAEERPSPAQCRSLPSLVVTLQQLGSLRPNLSGSKSHTNGGNFGFQSVEGNRTLPPISG